MDPHAQLAADDGSQARDELDVDVRCQPGLDPEDLGMCDTDQPADMTSAQTCGDPGDP
jgi:hypothetical protein